MGPLATFATPGIANVAAVSVFENCPMTVVVITLQTLQMAVMTTTVMGQLLSIGALPVFCLYTLVRTNDAACDTQHEGVGKKGGGLFSFCRVVWLSVCPGPPVGQPEHTDKLRPCKPVSLLSDYFALWIAGSIVGHWPRWFR